MKIYVVRHGRTDSNDQRTFNGRRDEDINQTGICQAEELREKMRQILIQHIYASPLKRTRHTCQIINEKNLPVIYEERLMERDMKDYTGKSLDTVDREEYWNYYSQKYQDTETPKEVFARVWEFLEELSQKEDEDAQILLVTHNGVTRAINCYFNGIPKDGNLLQYGQENCEVREYEMKSKKEKSSTKSVKLFNEF